MAIWYVEVAGGYSFRIESALARKHGFCLLNIYTSKESKRDNLEKVPKEFLGRDLSLKGLLRAYMHKEIPKEKHIRKGWEGEISEEKLEYAAKDVLYLHKLYDTLKEEIYTQELEDIAKRF